MKPYYQVQLERLLAGFVGIIILIAFVLLVVQLKDAKSEEEKRQIAVSTVFMTIIAIVVAIAIACWIGTIAAMIFLIVAYFAIGSA